MMSDMRSVWIIAMLMLGTLVTRFLPFLIFPAGKKTPGFVVFLGRTLPYATIGLLVVYCLKGIVLTAYPFGLPEILGVGVTALLHRWKSNSMISIGVGTVVYMILIQKVF